MLYHGEKIITGLLMYYIRYKHAYTEPPCELQVLLFSKVNTVQGQTVLVFRKE